MRYYRLSARFPYAVLERQMQTTEQATEQNTRQSQKSRMLKGLFHLMAAHTSARTGLDLSLREDAYAREKA